MILQLIAAVGESNSEKQGNIMLVKCDLVNCLKEKPLTTALLKWE